ncbi:MAG: nucleotide exchange factor GrpE, partial [Candidatus Omnitrophica bacterium]|nr:nucleotide exchange factor GrpE [Candidatus Omnitrophota bacterium]
QLIKKQIDDILKNNGLSKIEAIGKQFDPHMHEAIGVVSTDDHPADTVVEEIQCGYMFKDKLLRPSWVRIAEPSAVKELSTADTTHDTEDKGAEAREEKMPSSENNMADE